MKRTSLREQLLRFWIAALTFRSATDQVARPDGADLSPLRRLSGPRENSLTLRLDLEINLL